MILRRRLPKYNEKQFNKMPIHNAMVKTLNPLLFIIYFNKIFPIHQRNIQSDLKLDD